MHSIMVGKLRGFMAYETRLEVCVKSLLLLPCLTKGISVHLALRCNRRLHSFLLQKCVVVFYCCFRGGGGGVSEESNNKAVN